MTVWGSGVSMLVTSANVEMPRGWYFLRTSETVNLTSADVNGFPSWNFTFWRSLNVIVLPSGDTSKLSASEGRGFRSKSYSRRPSKTLAVTCPIGPDVEMYGARLGGSGCVI